MAQDELAACANCGEKIGRLETAYVFRDREVCAACWKKLGDEPGSQAIDDLASAVAREAPIIESPAETARRMGGKLGPRRVGAAGSLGAFTCPICGYVGPAKKKAKGSLIVLLVLLFLMVFPALIYLILYHGYIYACPRCKYKLGDVA